MKYKILLISIFIIMPLLTYCQTVTLKITGEGEALIGAHVYKNDKISTVTNANGIASVKANIDDKLTISYIGYNDENITVTKKMLSDGNITVNLQPIVFNLGEAKVTRAKSDMDILKSKLKKGLKLRVSPDIIDFMSVDTLLDINDRGFSIAINGNAIFKHKEKWPIININSINLLKDAIADTMKLKTKYTVKKSQTKHISRKIGNTMAAAVHIYKFRKMKIFYRGIEDNKDIFYFSFPEKTSKIDGLVYLNELGIIERVNCNVVSSTSEWTTYHADFFYLYFSNDNTVLPKSSLRTSYWFNSNMEIEHIEKESIELFHKNE